MLQVVVWGVAAVLVVLVWCLADIKWVKSRVRLRSPENHKLLLRAVWYLPLGSLLMGVIGGALTGRSFLHGEIAFFGTMVFLFAFRVSIDYSSYLYAISQPHWVGWVVDGAKDTCRYNNGPINFWPRLLPFFEYRYTISGYHVHHIDEQIGDQRLVLAYALTATERTSPWEFADSCKAIDIDITDRVKQMLSSKMEPESIKAQLVWVQTHLDTLNLSFDTTKCKLWKSVSIVP